MYTKPAPAGQIEGLTFGSTTPGQKTATRASWNRWDVVHTCIILGITVLFYIYFW
jgi:SSS family solute:Na+ symporter